MYYFENRVKVFHSGYAVLNALAAAFAVMSSVLSALDLTVTFFVQQLQTKLHFVVSTYDG